MKYIFKPLLRLIEELFMNFALIGVVVFYGTALFLKTIIWGLWNPVSLYQETKISKTFIEFIKIINDK